MKKITLKLSRKHSTSYKKFIQKPYKSVRNAKIGKLLQVNDMEITPKDFEALLRAIENKEYGDDTIRFFLLQITQNIIDDMYLDLSQEDEFIKHEQTIIDNFISQNTTLIKSLNMDTKKNISMIIKDAINYNQTPLDIIPLIRKELDSTYFRAETIAITETNKLNGQINMNRMLSQGLNNAIWSSAKDKRVRKCHLARDNKTYDIVKGCYSACDGRFLQVGQEIRCRCAMSIYIP